MTIPAIPAPEKRSLRVFAFDPMASHAPEQQLVAADENEVVLEVEYEPLQSGPAGRRIVVLDYDASRGCYYPPVDLDDKAILAQGGLRPAEGDPRFHQQMVYAVVMKTVENFDRALGRRIHFTTSRKRGFKSFGDQLCIFPHAFEQANAYFDSEVNAVVFGYFTADAVPGSPFVPGQTVFTCLSADVIAHETTHGLIHRLRPSFMLPTNFDVGGFHEGFSDIVAIFQHFTYPDLLRKVISRTRGELDRPGVFVDLAQQFGHGSGDGRALRTAIDSPDPGLYARTKEPHDLGAILVAAVFDAFFQAYRQRTADLIGDKHAPVQSLSTGVVNRVARDAETIAQQFLTMCIRAFEYLPVVDVTFGDFLRAAVTADLEINGPSTRRHRELLIDGFRRRGIYPDGVVSLSEASVCWTPVEPGELPPLPNELAADLLLTAQEIERGGVLSQQRKDYVQDLHAYAMANATNLALRSDVPIAPRFHTSFHVAQNGQLKAELVVRYEQTVRDETIAGMPVRGGTTLIANAEGTVRYRIAKPLVGVTRPEFDARARERHERTLGFVGSWDDVDAALPWMTEDAFGKRMATRLRLSRLHAARGGRS